MKKNKYVLFSAVGSHDPTANGHDGPMIHICRQYKPEKVYLFLTAEMYKLKCLDDRYSYALDRLGEELGYYIEREYIEHPEFRDVHIFDLMKDYFDPAIERVCTENPGKTILLNISSGSPAIKSYLLMKSILSEHDFVAVQVDTPERKSNPGRDKPENYDREAEWAKNADRGKNSNFRCREERYSTVRTEIIRENIRSHIDAYDYEAALREAEGIKRHLTNRAVELLEAASARLRLDLRKLRANVPAEAAGKGFGSVQKEDEPLFEYLLWLRCKLLRDDISDFVRGITPALYRLAHKYLRGLGVDIDRYVEGDRLKVNLLRGDEKGREYLEILNEKYKKYGGYVKDDYLSSDNCIALIWAYTESDVDADMFENLRRFEAKIRNRIAHDVVKIDRNWMIKQTGYEPWKIWDMFERLANRTLGLSKTDWLCYEYMNDEIKAELAKNPE